MIYYKLMQSYISNDAYKFSMKQGVWSQHPNAMVEYALTNRNKDIDLLPLADKIQAKIDRMHGLGPTRSEIAFLGGLGYLKPSYVEALSQFKLDTSHVKVGEKDGKLDIRVRGPWYQTIDFEVPILRAVNEAYFEQFSFSSTYQEGEKRLDEKIEKLLKFWDESVLTHPERHPYKLMEFGTRRAFSEEWQDFVVQKLAAKLPKEMLLGCSNVHLAMKYGLVPQGTMAHEWVMAFQAFSPLHLSQRDALYAWAMEFRGKLGIALSDTLGNEMFLRDFDMLLAGAFSGARHDSGDPYSWGEGMVEHYSSMGLNPFNKQLSFTDSLNIDKSIDLWWKFSDRIRSGFGIGTHLTNDLGPKALNIVMKMVKCNGMPLAKLSAEPGKMMCENPAFSTWLSHMVTEVIPTL